MAEFVPNTPNAEFPFTDICIMEQHDSAIGEFGLPLLEVVPNGIVGMETIDVQQINRTISDVIQSLVECAP